MWYHVIFVFLLLTSISMIISRSIHVAANALFYSLLWPSNIPCACVCVCVCVCVHHIFFIHLSAHGHLGCFHVLAILNCTAMNPGVACIFLNEFLSHKDNLSKRHIELSKSPLTCLRILRCLRDHVLSLSQNSHLKIIVSVSGILN